MTRPAPLPEPPSSVFETRENHLLFHFPNAGAMRWDGTTLTAATGSDLRDAASETKIILDQYGNQWIINRATEDAPLRVRPAQNPDVCHDVSVPDAAGPWTAVCGDNAGFVWVSDGENLFRHNPRAGDMSWMTFTRSQGWPDTRITTLAPSSDGGILAGFYGGEILNLDVAADGTSFLRPALAASDIDGPVDHLLIGRNGCIHAVSGVRLYSYAPESARSPWTELARLPCGNHDIFAAEYRGTVYVSGGLTSYRGYPAGTHVFDELFAYSPSEDAWSIPSRMPFPRFYNGLVAVGPRLWIVGGSANLRSPDDRDGPRDPLDSVLIYDILENRWENAPPLHEARIEPVVILARGRIYAAGGGDPQGNAMVTVESIAPGERSWRVEQALPAPMRQAAGCVVDERMYVCGKSGFWMFDPERGGWITALAQPPQLPQAPLMAAHQGDVWVMGGYRSRATWIYNPEENQWLSGPDLPTEQSWGAAWSLNGQIMAIAGAHWSETHGVFVFDNRVFAMKT